ncbi:hypothetical protein CONLIGDRAFT_360042 [Coniochaeta ligniaria NRRL 30616]|uniref:Uncharacterized protein n=1 Tax=Coniochaeta ligniaria NRRL 30616 TaxID=1408157 RepID=A0A1J7JK76_9PEZI|nr:hypothetical protein CONLIGDRAFT_360042 [Coniochaeta ligniaria NRRL 30616]
MRNCFVLFVAVLAKTVAGQSAVTVTAPAPSAPSPAQPPFSVSIVSAQPEPPAPVSSLTVFASPNPAPSQPSPPSVAVTTVTAGAASPSSSSGGSGGGSGGGGGGGGGGGSGGGGTGSGGICGLGYTYCGYILKDHQEFAEADIVKAYCAGSADNCASGTPKTDPMNALFICLPPTSSQRLGKRQGPQPSGGGSGGAAPPNGCSSTPGPGNSLQLLCSCGGQCLNPDADHIGRCDKPCV